MTRCSCRLRRVFVCRRCRRNPRIKKCGDEDANANEAEVAGDTSLTVDVPREGYEFQSRWARLGRCGACGRVDSWACEARGGAQARVGRSTCAACAACGHGVRVTTICHPEPYSARDLGQGESRGSPTRDPSRGTARDDTTRSSARFRMIGPKTYTRGRGCTLRSIPGRV